MPFINLSDPFSILVATVLFVLILFIARQMKNKSVLGIMLAVFLTIIVGHTAELFSITNLSEEIKVIIMRSITMDFVFIFISFISFLWIDDIETKEKNLKSINNSLDWFWKKV